MAAPSLTPEERAQLEADKAIKEGEVEAFNAQVPALETEIAEAQVSDGGFKKFFDYYNDEIIAHYDTERRYLDGNYIASPIIENDVIQTANAAAHRTTPISPDTDMVRIAEFDGGNLILDANGEEQQIDAMLLALDLLQNGTSGGSPSFNASTQTTTALDANSTTLSLEDSVASFGVSVGNEFQISGGGSSALIRVTSVSTGGGPLPGTPETADLGIEYIIAPTGTIPIGTTPGGGLSGFTDSERDTKTASDSGEQGIMDSLISDVEAAANGRISALDNQIAAMALNDDGEGASEFSTATTNANTSKSFLTNYLISTDISDIGITSVESEETTRSAQVSARVAEILSAYTGRSVNFYETRYNNANDRCNLARGSLRKQVISDDTKAVAEGYAQTAQDAVDAIDTLLATP